MKILLSKSVQPNTRFLYNKEKNEHKNIHDTVSDGAETVAKAPLRLVDTVSDAVHNTLKKVPLLKLIPYLTHPVVKGTVNGVNGVVGGTVNTASRLTTNTVGGAGKIVTGLGKGAVSYAPYSKARKTKEKAEEQSKKAAA